MSASRSLTTAEKLNWLFDVVRSEADQTYTARDVAQGVSAALGDWDTQVLEVAITALRAGRPPTLSRPQLEAIAEFFGTSPTYFGADGETLAQTQIALVSSELRRGGVELIRMCRTDLDLHQWLALELILLSCVRAIGPGEVDETPR